MGSSVGVSASHDGGTWVGCNFYNSQPNPFTHIDVQDELIGQSFCQTGHRGLSFLQESSETRQNTRAFRKDPGINSVKETWLKWRREARRGSSHAIPWSRKCLFQTQQRTPHQERIINYPPLQERMCTVSPTSNRPPLQPSRGKTVSTLNACLSPKDWVQNNPISSFFSIK